MFSSSPEMNKTKEDEKEQLIAALFEDILNDLQKINEEHRLQYNKVPSAFLIYAHDNLSTGFKADAEIAQILIKWLKKVDLNLYSDRTPTGSERLLSMPDNEKRITDILYNQLCILPDNEASVDYVILCGSELLKKYTEHEIYKNYKNEILKILASSDESSNSQHSDLLAVVNQHSKSNGFHHVLTELAFLHKRRHAKQPYTITLLLNGDDKTALPSFISNIDIRIEQTKWRQRSDWNGGVFENEGLYLGFLELLERLYLKFPETKEKIIAIKEEFLKHLDTFRSDELPVEVFNNYALRFSQAKANEKSKLLDKLKNRLDRVVSSSPKTISRNLIFSASSQVMPIIQSKCQEVIKWNLPRQDHLFVGRQELMNELELKLHPKVRDNSQDKKEILKSIQGSVVSVCAGLGGVGKTQLALQYVHHNLHPYTLKAWFQAENLETLKQQYIDFAKTLGNVEKTLSFENALICIKSRLLDHPEWLLIYDNVNSYEEIKSFLPEGVGSIILTTRWRTWPNTFKTVNINLMTEAEGCVAINWSF